MKNLIKYIIVGLLAAPLFALATPVSWDYASGVLQPLRSAWTAVVKGSYFTATSTTQSSTFPVFTSTSATTTNATSTNLAVSSSLNLFGGGAKTTANDLCIQLTGAAGLCDGSDDGGGGGSISTSSVPTAGNLTYWTSASALSDVATGTLTETVSGLELSATRGLVGGASVLSLTSGFVIPSTTPWSSINNFYNTPSTVITAGDALTWSSNTLNFDGGNTPSGDLGGTWASPSVTDDSHAHTGTTLSSIDISADTNLTADGTEIVLTDDALSLGNSLTFTSATATNLAASGSLNLFGAGAKTTANALCIQLTGAAELCDGVDNTAAGGSGIATSGPIANTEVLYATSESTADSEAAFTYNASTDILSVINGLFTSATSTTLQATTLGVGSDYITDITGSGLSIVGGALTASGGGSSNWTYDGSRLTPSTTVGVGIFASSTIGGGTGATGLTIAGNSTTTGNINFGGDIHCLTDPCTFYGPSDVSVVSVSFAGGTTLGYGNTNTVTTGGTIQQIIAGTEIGRWTTTGLSLGSTSPSSRLTVQGGDFYLGGNMVATGTATTSGLSTTLLGVGTDYISDITGTGIALSGSSLTATLGTDVSAGEIANGDHGFFSYSSGVATLDTGGLTSANLSGALSDETGSGVAVFATSPTLTTPNLGTPSAVTLTNGTGLPVSTGLSGLGANVATFLATPSSANLLAAITDEVGTGSLVFSASPIFTGTAQFAGLTVSSSSTLGYASTTAISGTTASFTNTSVTNATTTNLSPTAIMLDGTPNTDDTYSGNATRSFNSGTTTAQWDLVFLANDSTWKHADADAAASSSGMLGFAFSAVSSGTQLVVVTPGSYIRNDAWAWATGTALYISTTEGGLTATAPSGTDDVIRVVGYAVNPDVIYFFPEAGYITHT